MITTIVLDLDGTLYTQKDVGKLVLYYLTGKYDYELEELKDKWKKAYNKILNNDKKYTHPQYFYRDVDKLCLEYFGLGKKEIETTVIEIENLINKILTVKTPFPKIKEFLQACKEKNLKLYVLSGIYTVSKEKLKDLQINDSEQKRERVRKLGLTEYFDDVLSTLKYNTWKPYLNAFTEFLKEKNLKAEECVYIGNQWQDMEAKKVGMHTILINPNNDPYPPDKTQPEFTARDYGQILEYVKTLIQ